jgi:hypothetical protein
MLHRALVFALALETRPAVVNISHSKVESLRANIFEDVYNYHFRHQNPECMMKDVLEHIPKARDGSPLVHVRHANIGTLGPNV